MSTTVARRLPSWRPRAPARRSGRRCAALGLALWLGAAAGQPAPPACPAQIEGTWQRVDTTELAPILISFGADGWANVLSVLEGSPHNVFDTLAQVHYVAEPRRAPRRIEFHVPRRGNEVFPSGTSSWEIIAHTDDSLTFRRSDSEHGEQSLWKRVQTQRYFLTFAARPATDGHIAAAFVMWTRLDGRSTHREGLGVTLGDAGARFGAIPAAITQEFGRESTDNGQVMVRLELNEAEYLRSREVSAAWETLIANDMLATADPYRQTLELIEATFENVNRCGARLRAPERGRVPVGESLDLGVPLEFIRALRKANDRRHLPDKAFPFDWTPGPLS